MRAVIRPVFGDRTLVTLEYLDVDDPRYTCVTLPVSADVIEGEYEEREESA